MYTKITSLVACIDSNTTHGRKTLLLKIKELGLGNSTFYTMVSEANTNIGKNQLKFLLLDVFIANLKD